MEEPVPLPRERERTHIDSNRPHVCVRRTIFTPPSLSLLGEREHVVVNICRGLWYCALCRARGHDSLAGPSRISIFHWTGRTREKTDRRPLTGCYSQRKNLSRACARSYTCTERTVSLDLVFFLVWISSRTISFYTRDGCFAIRLNVMCSIEK